MWSIDHTCTFPFVVTTHISSLSYPFLGCALFEVVISVHAENEDMKID